MRTKNVLKESVFRLPLVVVMATLLSVFSCAEVPVTHRKGLHLVPRGELLSLSAQQYGETLKNARLSSDKSRVAMVHKVGERIAKAAEAFLIDSGEKEQINSYRWEFNLIEDDKTVNAWCMPGGKVAVYTGILPYTKDETGLAVVIGHEVAHAIADHGNERMSQGLLTQMGGMALSAAMSRKPQQTRDLFMAVFGVTANVAVMLPYSRLHENEADQIGLIVMARAGYDPREAIPFWQRMGEKEGQRPSEFLSTHPAPESRIANIKAHMPEALGYYQKEIR